MHLGSRFECTRWYFWENNVLIALCLSPKWPPMYLVLGILSADTLQCPQHVAMSGVRWEGGHLGTFRDWFLHQICVYVEVFSFIFQHIRCLGISEYVLLFSPYGTVLSRAIEYGGNHLLVTRKMCLILSHVWSNDISGVKLLKKLNNFCENYPPVRTFWILKDQIYSV